MHYFTGFKNSVNTNINIMITMLLGGLWHGSSWMFMIWGGLNGLGLVIHKLWQKVSPFGKGDNLFARFFFMLLTLTFISFTRIWFRSDDLQRVIGLLKATFTHLVLDLSKGFTAIDIMALEMATTVLLVAQLDLPMHVVALAPAIAAMIEQGLAAMKRTLEAAAVDGDDGAAHERCPVRRQERHEVADELDVDV